MPLPVRDFGTVDEDVLTCASRLNSQSRSSNKLEWERSKLTGTTNRLLLLDLNLADLARVENDLTDVGAMPRANFTKDPLVDVNDPTD